MYNPNGSKDLRKEQRIESTLAVRVSVGTQLTVAGQLKDISQKSAFITIKNNIFLAINDEVGISISCNPQVPEDLIEATARVSRIVPGEGLAVYFIKMDDCSTGKLKKLIG